VLPLLASLFHNNEGSLTRAVSDDKLGDAIRGNTYAMILHSITRTLALRSHELLHSVKGYHALLEVLPSLPFPGLQHASITAPAPNRDGSRLKADFFLRLAWSPPSRRATGSGPAVPAMRRALGADKDVRTTEKTSDQAPAWIEMA
jgi:hypothetical protein